MVWAYKNHDSLEHDLELFYDISLPSVTRTPVEASAMRDWLAVESPLFKQWQASSSPYAFCLGSKSHNDERLQTYFESEDVEKILRGNLDD